MDNSVKVFLDEYRSKASTNTSGGLNVGLMGSRKLLPTNDISNVMSQKDLYNEERENCNIIRLTCQVNPVCSNVLFNRITEVVKDEGSSALTFVNYGIGNDSTFRNVSGKSSNDKTIAFWSGNIMDYDSGTIENYFVGDKSTQSISSNHPTNSIRDLQLSKIGFDYHCGLDIFNTHLIRSKTFKTVCYLDEGKINGNNAFNTIADMMRDFNGKKVIENLSLPLTATFGRPMNNPKPIALHLYGYDDIDTFKDSIKNKLIDNFNGWVGFKNKSKIKSYKFQSKDKLDNLEIERPIFSDKNGGDFIDMYPGRDLYSFVPKYNSFKDRIEKNWNYCITYPSSSYTPSTDFEPFGEVIDSKLHSIRLAQFDENTVADNGSSQIVFYGTSKHGLSVGDYVNVYQTINGDDSENRTDEKIIDSARVTNVVDDYIFTIFNPDIKISKKWIETSTITDDDFYYEIDGNYVIVKATGKKYQIINNSYANIDDNAQRLSFKKVVNDIECEYYVRIFSKLPNFKWASGDTSTEYEIYRQRNSGKSMLETYQKKEYNFESHISRLAFARNSYTDNIGEVVFTDDIDISNIKDNLGRPITSLYLTFVKNNMGYKEWYGNGFDNWNKDNIPTYDNIEYSHCFGKIMCGLEMSFMCDDPDVYVNNIRTISYTNKPNRITIRPNLNEERSYINGRDVIKLEDDEVWFDTDINFYGDISYYDNYNAVERHIQPVMHRFNTAQREASSNNGFKSSEYFNNFLYDEIKFDDYDISSTFEIETKSMNGCNTKKEGYFYNPHYEIPIKTFGKLQTIMPDFLTLRNVKVNDNDNSLEITTLQNHYLTNGDKMIMYDWENMVYYYCTTIKNINDRVFRCNLYDEYGNSLNVSDIQFSDLSKYRAFKMDNLDAPSYAHLLKDGTCRVIWRDVLNNGFSLSDSTIEEYPFTNGAFYINKRIDLYVRRQDPHNEYGLYDEYDLLGLATYYEDEDNYVKEPEIEC